MAGVNKNFVVKNGLEVNDDLILADADKNQVGINTDNIKYTLHVNGGIGATTLYATGISTFNSIHLAGSVTAGTAGAGSTGQYLVRVGSGVSWQNLPSTRTTEVFTAATGQTVFSVSYTVGQLDVFINGVKLAESEYTANDTASVILNTACFGGETVEFISYSSVNPGYGFTGIYGISLFEDGVPVGTTGQVVSLNFVGTSVTATASGVGATIYLDPNLLNPNYWGESTTGIHTTSNVGIATTNPRFALEVGSVGASGTSLWVNGNARVTGILTVGSSSIVLDGSNNTINVGSGITINGNTGIVSASNFYANGIQVGVISATTIVYEGSTLTSSQWITTAAGIHTLGSVGIGTTNPTSALTVGGGTSTRTLHVGGTNLTGVATFYTTGHNTEIDNDGILVYGSISGASRLDPNYLSINSSVFGGTGSAITLQPSNNSNTGQIQFLSRTGLTGGSLKFRSTELDLSLSGNVNISGISTFAGITTVTGPTLFTNQLSVSGVSTFTGNVSFGTSAYFGDNSSLYFGNDNDLRIFYDGSLSRIWETGDFGLEIRTNQFFLSNQAGTEYLMLATQNAGVNLYYANSTKFETLGAGVTVTGTTFTNQLSVSGVSTFRDIISLSDSSSTYIVNARYDQINGFQVGAGYWQDRYLSLSPNLNYILPNVGIGTTNPTQKLDVAGSVKVGINTSQGVILTSPNGTKYQLFVEDDGTLKTIAV